MASGLISLVSNILELLQAPLNLTIGLIMSYKINYFEGVKNRLNYALFGGIKYREKDGIQLAGKFKMDDGFIAPCFPHMSSKNFEKVLERIINFKTRPDDIFVVSYPKCGHHFLHEILNMLLTGEPKLHKDSKVVNFLEFFAYPQERFDKEPSPRVILTHLPLRFLPKDIFTNKCKVIRCSRNPKDMIVSYFNHCSSIKFYDYTDSLTNFFKLALDGDVEYGCYFKYEKELLDIEHLDHVLNITFENLKQKPEETFKMIGGFLEMNHTDDFYKQVAVASSFSKVKAAKGGPSPFFKTGRSLYRKGVVGDWRNHLTVAMSEEIDARIQAEWSGTPLVNRFDYGS